MIATDPTTAQGERTALDIAGRTIGGGAFAVIAAL